MSRSVEVLENILDKHSVISGPFQQAQRSNVFKLIHDTGVNTAPGGNADSRTEANSRLQHSFFQHHQSGILPETLQDSYGGPGSLQSLQETVVRALAAVRCNSLIRGHSAIRQHVVESLTAMISQGITPLIPTRGSISASGDLSPLSYLGGMLEGNESIFVRVPDSHAVSKVISAKEALENRGLSPVVLEPKEGLAIMNGTSVSTAHAALVLHDCHDLAILCQLLTSMTVEALAGKLSNFHDFISDVRPHSGQKEVSSNIREFLQGSKLCNGGEIDSKGLAQDRYAIRTAPQWIGPQLEDLSSAEAQISIELNATTDNPLIDVDNSCVHHGGNFQAASLTSAMEKARNVITMLGRLLLAQSGELVNPDLNKGLPPNLCADDPTISFSCKGVDINMTAYYSELAFLANSVASHVQSAELNNQSVNSLALISSRMTERGTEILTMMVAAHLFTLCQAVDLRARDEDFLRKAHPLMQDRFADLFSDTISGEELSDMFPDLWSAFLSSWRANNRLESKARCRRVSVDMTSCLMEKFDFSNCRFRLILQRLQGWQRGLPDHLVSEYVSVGDKFSREQSTPHYLGKSTLRLYNFVRTRLGVSFHRGLSDHPPFQDQNECGHSTTTIGTQITKIFLAIQDKSIIQVMKE